MDDAERMLENARKNFAANRAAWDARTEAAVRSLIAAHLLDVEYLTMLVMRARNDNRAVL